MEHQEGNRRDNQLHEDDPINSMETTVQKATVRIIRA